MKSHALHLPKSVYHGPVWEKYLSHRDFMQVMGLAFAVHVFLFSALALWPRQTVINVPVHVLNLKLGGNEGVAEEVVESVAMTAVETPLLEDPALPNRNEVTQALEQAMTPAPAPTPAPVAEAKPAPAEPPKAGTVMVPKEAVAKSGAVKKYVREKAKAGDDGSRLGTSTAEDAEILARYEQLISQWIQRARLYPEEARAQRLEGDAIARIRIDRTGKIRFFTLEKATGSPILDKAITRMIERADPVPPVPDNYPAGSLLEFLVPIRFKLME